MSADPYKDLASAITGHVKKHINKSLKGVPCELGTITSTGALQLDTFKHPIQNFFLADWTVKLTIPAFSISGTQTGLESPTGPVTGTAEWSFSPMVIDGVHIEMAPDLQPGDRVLVIPVNNGRDVVVVGKVVRNGS
jgi:hypothetical protein